MWTDIVAGLRQFPPPILSGLGNDGYPFSMRCAPQVDERRRVLTLDNPQMERVSPGPANLTFHEHDEQLWNIRHLLIIGTLVRGDGAWYFQPSRLVGGLGYRGVVGQLMFAWNGRRTAARYLAARSLARPTIPWDEIKALWREVHAR